MQKRVKKKKRKKGVLQYWNPKLLNLEIQRCGYTFRASSYIKYLLAVYLGIAGFAYLFQLQLFFAGIVMIAASVFLPAVFLMNYKNLYEEKKFEDLTAYMEQLLYSFKRRAKILTALEDTKLLFVQGKSRLYDGIEYAVSHIQSAQSGGNLYEEAFFEIEKEYGCKRLYKTHDFLIKVERAGGNPDAAIEILLNDRKMWIDRIYGLQKEKKNIKIKVTIGIGLSLLICAMSILMLPREFHITQNPVSQAVTAATIILNMLIWYVAQKKLSGSLILSDEDTQTSEICEKYEYVVHGDRKREKIKYMIWGIAFAGSAIWLRDIAGTAAAAAAFGAAGWMMTQEKRKYRNARKAVVREVEKRFPEWLMNLSLQLQTDNVHVSLKKTISDAPQILKKDVIRLVEEIEQQPNSLHPYICFMKEFQIPDVLSAMKILYSMAAFGTGEMGNQIDALVQRNSVMMDRAERLKEEDMMAGVGFLVLLPMITGVVKMLADLVLVIIEILSVVNTI